MTWTRRLWLMVVLSGVSLAGRAQFIPRGDENNFPTNSSAQEQQDDYDVGPDTMRIFYFFADNPGEEFSFSDSLLGNFFHQYDPARRQVLDYSTLGNLGSAARPLVYEPRYRRGFDMGLHQYDLYLTQPSELPFYRIQRAVTNLAYYQRSEQADSYLTGQFSRNFADGLNFSIDYKRLSQLGSRNQFPNQNSRNTALATGLWYHSKDGRYDGFFSIAWNTVEQEDNGGVSEPPEKSQGFSSPNSAKVFLPEAQTRHRHNGFSYTHYFTFGPKAPSAVPEEDPAAASDTGVPLGPRGRPGTLPPSLRPPASDTIPALVDSIPAQADSSARQVAALPAEAAPDSTTGRPLSERRRFTLVHQIQYQSSGYKFFDGEVDNEDAADYYGDFLIDTRGLRFFMRHRQLENTFRLRTSRSGKGNNGDRRQRDLLEAGLLHRADWLNLEIADSTVNNLFLFGRLHFQPNDRLRIRTYGHLGLLDHTGDYRAFGELSLRLGNLGQLTLTANNQLYEPNLIQDRFVATQRPVWNTDFKKTLETNLTATYALPQWRFEVSGRYHLINNYIYFDSLASPRQTGVPVSILQLVARKDFTVGKFHLDNTVVFQSSSEEVIRVPEIFTKNSLYYEGKWFGVMLIRLGFDLRYNTAYRGYYYHPLIGQFILNDQLIDAYPSMDAFISLRVTRFRAFFKYENLTSFALPDRLFYQQAYYPFQTGSGLRFGIKWRFVD